MPFAFHVVSLSLFESVLSASIAAKGGNTAPLRELCSQALQKASTEPFISHHAELPDVTRDWVRTLESTSPEKAPALDLFACLVSVVAMPQFQRFSNAGLHRSPYLVELGDGDGGAYGDLVFADSWFAALLDVRLPEAPLRYSPEETIAVLSREDVSLLRWAIQAVRAPSTATSSKVLEKLLQMVNEVLANPDLTIAVVG